MHCIFCRKLVYGKEGVTVPGRGPAHMSCLEYYNNLNREFKGLDISRLCDQELVDLQDLVLAEMNTRRGDDFDGDAELP